MLSKHGAARALAVIALAVAAASLAGRAGAVPLENDSFSAAIELTGRSDAASGTNKDATKEPGEPNHANELGGASVWFHWTAPVTGEITIDTCGSDFDTLLAAYTGDAVNALTKSREQRRRLHLWKLDHVHGRRSRDVPDRRRRR